MFIVKFPDVVVIVYVATTSLMNKVYSYSLHGLEACPLLKSDLSFLDFVVNRLFMKLFKTSNIARCC